MDRLIKKHLGKILLLGLENYLRKSSRYKQKENLIMEEEPHQQEQVSKSLLLLKEK
jgi:hypothetical protein